MDLFFEQDKSYDAILSEKKNFVFMGEAGSGKSEIVLNTAMYLAEKSGQQVELFDMDQTKPLFRSRDMAEAFADKGVNIHFQDQYLDAPTLVGGVGIALQSDSYALLDIGGGQQAAKFAGAYSQLLSMDNSIPIYVINPYRPWTRNIESIDGTMSHILKSIRLEHIYLLANPNLGCSTSTCEFLKGLDRLDEMLDGVVKINSACIRKEIYEEARLLTDRKLFPIELYLTYPWVDLS